MPTIDSLIGYSAGTIDSLAVNVTAPAVGTTVVDHGKTFTWDLAQNFTVDAPLGTVRTKYPSMAYFDTASQGFRDTSNQGYWAPDKVLSVSNGVLDFNMHSETINGVSTPLVSCVMPDNYQFRTYGVFEVRYKTTANKKGYKFVGMFWPTNDNWNQGEIDWPEADLTETPRPANAVPGTGKDASGQPADGSAVKSMSFVPPTAQYAATDSSDWHTARTVWAADGLYFYWDSALVWSTNDTSVIPTKPMRIELQAETFIGEGTVPADAVGHVLVDYVAAATFTSASSSPGSSIDSLIGWAAGSISDAAVPGAVDSAVGYAVGTIDSYSGAVGRDSNIGFVAGAISSPAYPIGVMTATGIKYVPIEVWTGTAWKR